MTEIEKLIKALSTGDKTKAELEPYLGFKSVLKHVVDRARKRGYQIIYRSGIYRLEGYEKH